MPLDTDVTVLASGVVEIALGASLIAARSRRRTVGLVAAGFFAAVSAGAAGQREGTLRGACQLPGPPVVARHGR